MKPEDDASASRRQFVGGMTAGLAAAFVSPAFGQHESGPAGSLQGPGKQDPTTQYPRPPFPPQKQEPPGLAIKMIPRPDHGETTYKGSGRLMGRKALVTGGDSGIGRAAVIAFAREGADVAINYLPVEEPDAREVVELIRAEGRKAVAIPGDIRNEDFCSRLVADAVRDLGGLDILVNNAAMAALLTRMSNPPSSRTASATSLEQKPSFRMSPGIATAFRPSARINSTTSRASGSSTGR